MKNPSEEDWSELYGRKFEHNEIREACDIFDLLRYFCEDKPEMLPSFVRENMKLGHRLFMAMNLEPDDLGVLVLREEDDRIVHVIKERCAELNRQKQGRSNIILPGE